MSDHDTATYQDFLKDFQPGMSLGTRYKILKTIGAGGMGRVFLAHDLELDIDVALKVIRPELLQNEKALERFKNELILARKVSHKNVVRIHDMGEVRGLKYLSMSYIPGKSLKEILKQSGGLDVQRAVSLFMQICEGVASAHDEGVMHRDLKPANVMLDEGDRVYITDFGIAKWLDSPDETGTGVLIGTPAYLSPEQTWGERPDGRSDIYALGLILYELLTGVLPFEQENAVAFKSRIPADFEKKLKKFRPETPRYVISILKKCLDPNRSNRYQTVAAILNDLRDQKVKKKFLPAKYFAVAAVLLLIALGFVLWNQRRHQPKSPEQATVSTPVPATIRSAVVLPFRNQTGNEGMNWVETTMADMLISDLAQAGNLRILNQDRVFQTLKDLKISPGSYDDETARKLGEVLDVDLMILGNVTQAGSALRAEIELADVKDPSKTSHFKADGNKQEDLIRMVDLLARNIQRQISPAPAPVRSVAEVSSPSLAVLQLFNQGATSFRQGDYPQASEAFNKCILMDPKFARGYLKLGQVYEKLGQDEEALATLRKAIDLANQRDEKTSLMIRAEYSVLQGNPDQAVTLYQTMSQKFPNDPEVLLNLAGIYEENGDLKKSVVTLQKMVRIDPNNPQAYFQLGKDTILTGEPEKAISQFLIKALSIQTQLNNLYGKADVLNAMGVAYERLGRYDDAIKYYQDSFALKEQIGNKKGASTSLSNIAKIYIFQSQFDKAKKILNQALNSYQEMKDAAGIADVQNSFGVIYENQGQYEQALKYYKNALQTRKELGDDRLTALSYENIGQIYYLMAHYDEAQAFDEQALALRKKMGDQNGIILSLQSLGFLQIAQGDMNQAVKYFLDALNQARSIQFENAIAVSLGNLGTIYQNQGRYNAALDSYQEAIDVLKTLKDKKGEAEYTKLAGATFLDMGSYGNARQKLSTASQIGEQIQTVEIIADVQTLLGRLDRMQGNTDQARNEIEEAIKNASRNNYQKGVLAANIEKGLLTNSVPLLSDALKQAKELGDVWLILASQYAMANYYLQKGESSSAIQTCEDALPMAKKIGLPPYLYRFHSISAQAYARLKKEQQTREHFQQAAGFIENIRKELKTEYVSDFLKLDEVKATTDAMK